MSLRLTRTRFSWYFPLFLVIVCVIGVISSLYIYQSVGASLRQSLINRAETIALALDPADLASLKGADSDLNLPQYGRLKEKLTSIREANQDSRFVYIMGKRGGNLYFFADSEDPQSEDYSPPGQIYYEDSPAFENAFASKAPGSEGPSSDRWGTWITGVAPIMRPDGEVLAAVGIDVDAHDFEGQVMTYTLLPIAAMLILISFVYFGMRLRNEEQEFIEMKSKFIAVASHDIRSPLTGINWAMQSLVASPRLQPEDRRLASEISDQLQHLLVTSNDILDALSLDMPKVNMLNSELKLSEIIAHSVEAMKFFARQEQVEISVESIPDGAMIQGDPNKLEQLFINLLSNAVKYSHPHTDIAVGYKDEAAWHVMQITDSGIGIPKADQKEVFKGFFRSRNAEMQVMNGTGLGLYLVKRIAQLHGGEVFLASEENKGTTVTVRLPKAVKAL